MTFFAEGAPALPVEMAGWLACLAFAMWMIKTGQDIYHRAQPMPPMEKQLHELERRLMERLDQQDQDSIQRLAELRAHLDAEVHRVHERIDAQGRELFTLKGFVYGSKGVQL